MTTRTTTVSRTALTLHESGRWEESEELIVIPELKMGVSVYPSQ